MYQAVSGAAAVIALCCALCPFAGLAAEAKNLGSDAPAAAEQRYLIGKELYRTGKFAEAAAEFAVAFEMVPTSAKLAYNLARCHERAGQLTPAIAAFERYLVLNPKADDRPQVEATIAALRRRLEQTLPALVLTSVPEGATVALDDDPPLEQTTPVTVRVAPGAHVVRYQLDGYAPAAHKVTVRAGESNAAHVELRARPPEPAPVEPPPAEPAVQATAPTEPSADWRPIAGWSAVGVGAAAMIVGGIYGGLALDTKDQMAGLEARDWREYDDLDQDYGAQQTLAWSGLVGGAVVAGAGAALLLWSDANEAATALRATPNGLQGVFAW